MAHQSPNVLFFPVPSSELIELVREIGRDSSRWGVLKQYSENQEWRRITNRREIEFCLKQGHILEKQVSRDEHGCFRFKIQRVTSGRLVVIDVALDDVGDQPRIYVLDVESK